MNRNHIIVFKQSDASGIPVDRSRIQSASHISISHPIGVRTDAYFQKRCCGCSCFETLTCAKDEAANVTLIKREAEI